MIIATKWYVRIRKPEHPRANKQGQVKRSVLVMEEAIGRYLLPNERVHHKHGLRDDNRIENLVLITPSQHMSLHMKGIKLSPERCLQCSKAGKLGAKARWGLTS